MNAAHIGRDVFVGSGEMAQLMRDHDWGATSLGPVDLWPEGLKVALRIMLTSRFDMWLGWGPEINFLYNDAYRPTLGLKHPASLAAPTPELWAEIWPEIEPLITSVYERGEATWSEALLLLLERDGYPEETYHTFSYSPIFDDDGSVGGLLCAVVEDTARVINERRLDALRMLGAALTASNSVEAVLAAVHGALSGNQHDMPFTLTYLLDGDSARLAARTGFSAPHPAAPETLATGDDSLWTLDRRDVIVPLGRFGDLPRGPWSTPPAEAVVIPLDGQSGETPFGALVVGLNPHRPFDADYAGFLDLVAGQISAALARVRAAESMAGERDRLRAMFQNAPGFMCVLRGPEHVFEFTNEAYLQLIGHRDVVGQPVRKALPEIDGQGFFDLLDQVYRSGTPYVGDNLAVMLQRAPDAPLEERFINLVYQPVVDAVGTVTGIFAEGHDVTDRVHSEAALRALNADLERQVIERTQARGVTWAVSPDLLGALNSEGYFETSNPAWQSVLGWSEDEVASMKVFDFVHPDDLAGLHEGHKQLLRGEPLIRMVNRYRCKDGGYRWMSWVAIPEDGRVYCSGRDVTVEKAAEAELQSAQEALRQSQKMEAVGQLTGGIAHDFNNLLAGISGNLELLDHHIGKGRVTGLDRYIGGAQDAARRAAALTQRLLAFSRRQTLDPRPTDVNRLIAGMEDLIRRTVGPENAVEVVGAGGLWLTRIDQSQLENALLNLCINARDAMTDGGRVTIETANKWLDDRAAKARELPPGQYVSLCVTDTGTGMTPDVIAQAFDPFFTTKPMGRGTGLGLSMIHGFVRQSGGQVRIYSEVGAGTTMCLYLPRFAGALDDDVEGERGRLDPGHGEIVLVIDDEPVVRDLVVEILEDAGYRVLQADDGPTGLRLLQTDARIDLLITDVGLPGGLNGRQVADAARATRPTLKTLFITGYAENAAVGNGHLDAGMEVITKPFAVAALSSKVREMLDR